MPTKNIVSTNMCVCRNEFGMERPVYSLPVAVDVRGVSV